MTTLRGMVSLMAGARSHETPYRAPDAWQTSPADSDDADGRLRDETPIEITHERARELLLRQSGELLPAAEANALADHLLTCDACYRFAQDVAARQHRQPTP